jgi:7-keto-8-aminopelargonate synthetase-like enzyme
MNKFTNIKKAKNMSQSFWQETNRLGLIGIEVNYQDDGMMLDQNQHEFINMCSYSYLGLDGHPDIIKGAVEAIIKAKTLNSTISRVRVCLEMLSDTEAALSKFYQCEALTVSTCAAASCALLPLLASGALTKEVAPLMIFDKHAHFSINLMKPICADETDIESAPHNDLNFVEDLCKKNKLVAYVADGVYSTGGHAPVKDLMYLQDKYGLILYFDEAHSISAYGKNGIGFVLDEMGGNLNEKTFIVASLNKAFGASGGLILMHKTIDKDIVLRYGGPLSWSQRVNTPGLGAIMASLKIHQSPELAIRQKQLTNNIQYFDSLTSSPYKDDKLAIRFVGIDSEEKTMAASKAAYEAGFYTSPLFFPIVPRGKSGLRVMLRSDLSEKAIKRFCDVINRFTKSEKEGK